MSAAQVLTMLTVAGLSGFLLNVVFGVSVIHGGWEDLLIVATTAVVTGNVAAYVVGRFT